MKYAAWTLLAITLPASTLFAQPLDLYGPPNVYGQEYIGSPTPGGSEPLYKYDDLEVWKHGWLQINPYEHGYHSYRPYNYKHVLSQAAQSSVWGMPSTMPYSQSYYLRHGPLTGINGEPLPMGNPQAPSYNAPQYGAPAYPTPAPGLPGYGVPTSMLRQPPFPSGATPQQLNNVPGLTQLPGHQFPSTTPQAGTAEPQMISPANFQQLHQNPAAAAEYQRQLQQKAQFQQFLQQPASSTTVPRFR